jgi:hypothetical protein
VTFDPQILVARNISGLHCQWLGVQKLLMTKSHHRFALDHLYHETKGVVVLPDKPIDLSNR